jgi:hypothetical protein
MYTQEDVTCTAIIKSDDASNTSSVSIVVSIPACHVGDLGSIPRRSDRKVFSAIREIRVKANLFVVTWQPKKTFFEILVPTQISPQALGTFDPIFLLHDSSSSTCLSLTSLFLFRAK